jgi:hypothetical protein
MSNTGQRENWENGAAYGFWAGVIVASLVWYFLIM